MLGNQCAGTLGIVLAGNPKLAHLGVQGGALQAQAGGSAVRAGNESARLPQRLQNVIALGVCERGRAVRRGGLGTGLQLRQRHVENRPHG
jgi:hypothetical protein